MVATSASGTNAVKFGTMRENVLNLEVVLPDATVIRTAGSSRARKTSAGYNLTNLFVVRNISMIVQIVHIVSPNSPAKKKKTLQGSEGTLGIITKATLKLHPTPQCVSVAICTFNSVKDAVETVIDVRRTGVPIARVEFLDDSMLAAVNSYSHTNYEVTAGALFFEFHGLSDEEIAHQVEVVSAIAQDHNKVDWKWATEPEDRATLWQARHNAYYAAKKLLPNSIVITTDVCVPISRLAEVIVETKQDILQSKLRARKVLSCPLRLNAGN